MERLKQLREKKGLYQKDIAEFLKIDRTTYVKYEGGKNEPDIETLKKLAEYFETSIDYLTGRTDYTDFENEIICENLTKYLTPYQATYEIDGALFGIKKEVVLSIINGTYKFTKENLSTFLSFFNLTEADLLESKKEKPAENDELEDKNVKFIGRDGTVKFKKLSPEMIAMLEQLPDSGDDI